MLAGCTCQKLNSSYCEVRCWAYRLYHANRQISFLMFFHRGSNRVTRGQGRVPRVCTEEQIKGSALWYSTLPVMRKEKKKKKITRTWPYLYDSSSTFSWDQSFFIISKHWQTVNTHTNRWALKKVQQISQNRRWFVEPKKKKKNPNCWWEQPD